LSLNFSFFIFDSLEEKDPNHKESCQKIPGEKSAEERSACNDGIREGAGGKDGPYVERIIESNSDCREEEDHLLFRSHAFRVHLEEL
jgi:hypothetical protein